MLFGGITTTRSQMSQSATSNAHTSLHSPLQLNEIRRSAQQYPSRDVNLEPTQAEYLSRHAIELPDTSSEEAGELNTAVVNKAQNPAAKNTLTAASMKNQKNPFTKKLSLHKEDLSKRARNIPAQVTQKAKNSEQKRKSRPARWGANERIDRSKALRFRDEDVQGPPPIEFLASFGDPNVPREERKLIYTSWPGYQTVLYGSLSMVVHYEPPGAKPPAGSTFFTFPANDGSNKVNSRFPTTIVLRNGKPNHIIVYLDHDESKPAVSLVRHALPDDDDNDEEKRDPYSGNGRGQQASSKKRKTDEQAGTSKNGGRGGNSQKDSSAKDNDNTAEKSMETEDAKFGRDASSTANALSIRRQDVHAPAITRDGTNNVALAHAQEASATPFRPSGNVRRSTVSKSKHRARKIPEVPMFESATATSAQNGGNLKLYIQGQFVGAFATWDHASAFMFKVECEIGSKEAQTAAKDFQLKGKSIAPYLDCFSGGEIGVYNALEPLARKVTVETLFKRDRANIYITCGTISSDHPSKYYAWEVNRWILTLESVYFARRLYGIGRFQESSTITKFDLSHVPPVYVDAIIRFMYNAPYGHCCRVIGDYFLRVDAEAARRQHKPTNPAENPEIRTVNLSVHAMMYYLGTEYMVRRLRLFSLLAFMAHAESDFRRALHELHDGLDDIYYHTTAGRYKGEDEVGSSIGGEADYTSDDMDSNGEPLLDEEGNRRLARGEEDLEDGRSPLMGYVEELLFKMVDIFRGNPSEKKILWATMRAAHKKTMEFFDME